MSETTYQTCIRNVTRAILGFLHFFRTYAQKVCLQYLKLWALLLLLLPYLVTGLFFLVLLRNQRWSPPLTLQTSHCGAFRIMCDVPSIAVFCRESIECFPGTAAKFFLKLLVIFQVAPVITGTIVHFRFHIRCISIYNLLYFNLFSSSFCTTFLSAGIATSISVHVFSFLFLIMISGLFAVTSLSVCTASFQNTVTYYYYYAICMSPVTGISSWYVSWTSGDPHRSGFKLHIAVLSVLCVMFQV